MNAPAPDDGLPRPPRGFGFRTASARNLALTVLPDRLSGGLLRARHLAQPIELSTLSLASPAWPRDFDGLRIAHLSDLHFGHLLGE